MQREEVFRTLTDTAAVGTRESLNSPLPRLEPRLPGAHQTRNRGCRVHIRLDTAAAGGAALPAADALDVPLAVRVGAEAAALARGQGGHVRHFHERVVRGLPGGAPT
eukprot:3317210-Prymnesium_polylepis.1